VERGDCLAIWLVVNGEGYLDKDKLSVHIEPFRRVFQLVYCNIEQCIALTVDAHFLYIRIRATRTFCTNSVGFHTAVGTTGLSH
jgi:hypothetical protein